MTIEFHVNQNNSWQQRGRKKELQAACNFSVLIAFSIPCSTGVRTGSVLLQAADTAAGEREEAAGEDNLVPTSPPEPPGQHQHPNLALLPAVLGKSPLLRHGFLLGCSLSSVTLCVFLSLFEDKIFTVPCGS